jgi:aspartyl-tRNA(Asn)/glutamyl-tRNA(Gln) amidotransferase subunit B
VPLLEIVTEPDLHTPEEVRAYATALRSLLCYLGVNSGDLQKGVMRIEPNVSVRPVGEEKLGTRVEIKNLNSFRALERGVAYEIQRQIETLRQGKPVIQETVGWDVDREVTFSQRVKEGEEDYRYFPEPDLPPLVLDPTWVEKIRSTLPELPAARLHRFQAQYGLNAYTAGVLTAEPGIADYFERTASVATGVAPKTVANWISGELFSLMNQTGMEIENTRVTPQALAELLQMLETGEINTSTAKAVLSEMFQTGKNPGAIVTERGLSQISDEVLIADLVSQVLAESPTQVNAYLAGKETIDAWFVGQVMRAAQGKANPQLVRSELNRRLSSLKKSQS